MLTSMTKIVNVTYHHDNDLIIFLQYSPIGISSAFILPTVSPFGIDGNIDEKYLVPRIPTLKDWYLFFSNPLHQLLSPIDIPQCALYHAIISPFNILYIKLFFMPLYQTIFHVVISPPLTSMSKVSTTIYLCNNCL